MIQNKNVKKKIEYSVVSAVYNSEGSLKLLYERLDYVFRNLGVGWELILVNDCSKDRSWDVIKDIVSTYFNVTGVNLMNNFGQQGALMCGFKLVSGDYVLTVDDDLQHIPEEIPKLIKTLETGNYDVVYAQFPKRSYAWYRNFGSRLVNKLLGKITGLNYEISQFKLFRRSVIDRIVKFPQPNVMNDVLIKDVVHKNRIGHCNVQHQERPIGKSNFNFKKLSIYAFNMIFNFTIWPLRLASILGLFFSVVSFLVGIYFLIYNLVYGSPVLGWTSLILTITFFSGVILFVLGILGEYMGRIFLNLNHKPQYVIREVVGKNVGVE